ncbi:MAG: SprT family zinc-dependent metalloprotease [Ignavibacteria bacterium]|nr:SprT family zinc-dependent metalloprotease [Ignavibacteria bacterium]
MKTFLLDDVEIKIYKSSLARKITISIRPHSGARITIPRYVSYLEAERFAHLKRDWIAANLKKLSDYTNGSERNPVSGFVTKKHQLILEPKETSGVKVRVQKGTILVKYNSELEQDSKEVRTAVNKGILLALKKEAVEYMPTRLSELAKKCSLSYNNVAIKNMKSRWGSCSGRNNINLTIHLMRLPFHMVDYVLLHELAHTIVKNHSKRYWETLEKICPGSKQMDKELKSHKIMPL